MNMRKYFNVTILMLTISSFFFSCSDSDDSYTPAGTYIPKEITVSGFGTADNPAGWGKEITITGEGFSAATELYLVPPQSNIDPDKGIELEIVERTANTIKFLAPLSSGKGEYELVQSEGEQAYSLGSIFLKKEKYPARLVGPILTSEWGLSGDYTEFKYEKGQLMSITKFYVDSYGASEAQGYSFTYNGDQLSSVVVAQGDYVMKTYTFSYQGNKVLVRNDGGQGEEYVRNHTLTLNADGAIIERVDEWAGWDPLFDDDGWWIEDVQVALKDVYDYTYDDSRNMTGYTLKHFKDEAPFDTDSYMRLEYDSKNAFIPHLLPAWFWDFTLVDVVGCVVGHTNNVVASITPESGMPFAADDEANEDKVGYEIEYDQDEYPISVTRVITDKMDGAVFRNKLFDIIYN